MFVIIPLGGTGQRFKKFEYTKPKALIEVDGKCIIFHLLDNLNLKEIESVCIPYNKEYADFQFEKLLVSRYPKIDFQFLKLNEDTRGAAETINKGLELLKWQNSDDKPILCLDSDSFYLSDIISEWKGKNVVFTFNDTRESPIFSYVKLDEDNNIVEIKEKIKISDFANTGAYGFESMVELEKFTDYIIKNDIRQKNEFYTSGVIDHMLKKNINFQMIEVLNKDFFSLGTPEQVKEYEHPFIFDLDGTLVDTDDIYTVVWNNIMKKYGLSIDENFFKFFIQGKNDITFLKGIVPNITEDEIKIISELKDKYFIELLSKTENDIMIPGAKNFINNNKNRRMCIVTSCNKKSAEYIMKKTKLDQFMQFLIASEDCTLHKPNKEPYQKAIDRFKCNENTYSIFEDSNSGYKSAKSVGCSNICLIIGSKSSETILNCDEYKIKNYDDFELKQNENKDTDVCKFIMESLELIPIKKVTQDQKNLKTGYICDIKSFTLHLTNTSEKIILKIENTDNDLSNVARDIKLYTNEVYFYDHLSKLININVPKFYKSLIIDDKRAILLENLNDYEGKFNINLNQDIDALFSVLKHISDMHNYFEFNNESEIIPSMKSVVKIHEIDYYKKIIDKRFSLFLKLNKPLLSSQEISTLKKIYQNYDKLIKKSGSFPLNFCHGDLKSPNIFYKKECDSKNDILPIFLDWQYIHLNKGISDIVFLLTESTEYNEHLTDLVLKYYFKKSSMYSDFEDLLVDFKISLCVFPFFVLVWFNSENRDNLLDKVFPISFMKNVLKFYNKYLDSYFLDNL